MSGVTRVLHLQKVAGISGSEAHLLSLLPRLRERGWDIRMLMLHENEPGAWDFARALEARGVPLDAMRLRADVDPLAFFQLVGYLARHRPGILHTHLVHADAYGQMAGRSRACRCASRRSTGSTSSARAGLRVRRPHRRQLRPRAHRDLARARALSRRDRGLPRGELRDRPLRDHARRGAEAVRRRRRRACSASAA